MKTSCELTLSFEWGPADGDKAFELIKTAIGAGFSAEIVPLRINNSPHEFAVTIRRGADFAHGTMGSALYLCARAANEEPHEALRKWMREGLPDDVDLSGAAE